MLTLPAMAFAQQRPGQSGPRATRAEPKAAATKPAETKPAEAKPADPNATHAPYDRDLARLAEVMGSLAFLRTLCKAPDAAEWRTRMKNLVDVEAQTEERRDRLAGAFNKGFQGFALTYRQCTPSAGRAIDRYLAEGQALQRSLASRYGG
ncbi:TIGR02301 family protein [Chelatococcus reniformis]|nr:TIGR02301 family protein [Chelatococcus reniformis]